MYPETDVDARKFTRKVAGEDVSGKLDAIAVVDGKWTAIEAKYVDDWATSLRNPASPNGQTPWAIKEQQAMIAQARKYSTAFDGDVVYHTNSVELASYYEGMFYHSGQVQVRDHSGSP